MRVAPTLGYGPFVKATSWTCLYLENDNTTDEQFGLLSRYSIGAKHNPLQFFLIPGVTSPASRKLIGPIPFRESEGDQSKKKGPRVSS